MLILWLTCAFWAGYWCRALSEPLPIEDGETAERADHYLRARERKP